MRAKTNDCRGNFKFHKVMRAKPHFPVATTLLRILGHVWQIETTLCRQICGCDGSHLIAVVVRIIKAKVENEKFL